MVDINDYFGGKADDDSGDIKAVLLKDHPYEVGDEVILVQVLPDGDTHDDDEDEVGKLIEALDDGSQDGDEVRGIIKSTDDNDSRYPFRVDFSAAFDGEDMDMDDIWVHAVAPVKRKGPKPRTFQNGDLVMVVKTNPDGQPPVDEADGKMMAYRGFEETMAPQPHFVYDAKKQTHWWVHEVA